MATPVSDLDKMRWAAVYGAMVAHQVRDLQEEGKHLKPADVKRFGDEAKAVADWDAELNHNLQPEKP